MAMIGRKDELQTLEELYKSDQPELLVVFGRRRVGKTYLIREFLKNKNAYILNVMGIKDGALFEQIDNFTKEVGNTFYNGAILKSSKNWNDTFDLLTKAISVVPKNKKIVLFFDEFPWMATRKSKLLQNLDYYWNQHWSRDKRIKLLICGSSASWIIDKIINNKGGLHNRITKQIHVEPFNLSETKRFLNMKGINLNSKQILELYMAIGGIPYYLNEVQKGLSATQNIENLAFKKKSILFNEFDNLYSSLFNNYEICIDIIRLISKYQHGIGQELLFKKMKKNIKGKLGLTKLKELEDAGFIMSFKPHLHQKRGIYYKLVDEYTLFYLKWIEPVKETLLQKNLSRGYWIKQHTSASWYAWSGLAFESICYKHLPQISNKLKISQTAIPNTWRYAPSKGKQENNGAQIDLLFDRDDDSITICEIKYTNEPFMIDKEYAAKLKRKIDVFKKVTRTNKHIFLAIIAANGIKNTMFSEEMVDGGIVTLSDLFE